jgi:hypothetical protein
MAGVLTIKGFILQFLAINYGDVLQDGPSKFTREWKLNLVSLLIFLHLLQRNHSIQDSYVLIQYLIVV